MNTPTRGVLLRSAGHRWTFPGPPHILADAVREACGAHGITASITPALLEGTLDSCCDIHVAVALVEVDISLRTCPDPVRRDLERVHAALRFARSTGECVYREPHVHTG